ncbi:ATP-binding cassette domain-containing protein [bacterium]|nr:ATP-binding cassette domain-containing protein [bacterium]
MIEIDKLDEKISFDERRRYSRLPIEINILISTELSEHTALTHKEERKSKDISDGGICFKTQEGLKPDSLIYLRFSLPDSSKEEITAKGIVKWQRAIVTSSGEKYYETGLEFEHIEKNAVQRIVKFVKVKEIIINIVDLHKSFGYEKILEGVNLKIRRGETIVVIGCSGCGKTVLLRHIIGLVKPDSGILEVDGIDIAKISDNELNKIRRKFGMLFQSAALLNSLTVAENIKLGLKAHTNLSEEDMNKIVKNKLGIVGLDGTQNLKPADLSGGMKKRVGLARAVSMDPEIMLYDEPTTGLDPVRSDSINKLILGFENTLNTTSIVITHDMVSAYQIADRIAMLYNGEIIQVGTVQEIKNTDNPIVKQFITGSNVGPITDKETELTI